jgi:heme-degrading monooxygenase HmoA
MFVRILRIQTHLDRIDEAATLFKDKVIPTVKEIKGYKGSKYMADRKTGNCIIMTMWETEEDLLETEHSRLFQEQVVKFLQFFITPPIREIFEIVYSD